MYTKFCSFASHRYTKLRTCA